MKKAWLLRDEKLCRLSDEQHAKIESESNEVDSYGKRFRIRRIRFLQYTEASEHYVIIEVIVGPLMGSGGLYLLKRVKMADRTLSSLNDFGYRDECWEIWRMEHIDRRN